MIYLIYPVDPGPLNKGKNGAIHKLGLHVLASVKIALAAMVKFCNQ